MYAMVDVVSVHCWHWSELVQLYLQKDQYSNSLSLPVLWSQFLHKTGKFLLGEFALIGTV